jgi:hypothetical protein
LVVTAAGQGFFAGTGSIGRYWQARSVGFEVRSVGGERLGIVTRVGLNPESQRVHALYVRAPHRADPVVVDAASVAFVDPWQELLIVEHSAGALPPSETTTVVNVLPAVAARSAPIAWHRALPVGAAVAERVWSAGQRAWSVACSTVLAVRRFAVRLGGRAAASARSAAPPARRSAVWLGKRAAYAAAFLVWLYGAVVFVLAQATARVVVFLVAALSGVLRWVGPRVWSSTKKVAVQARDFSARHSISSR